MKKSGFILVELIAAMAILSILLISSLQVVKYSKSHFKKADNMLALYEVRDMISFSKEYCFENQVYGDLYFDNCDELSKVYLVCGDCTIRTKHFKEKYKIGSSNYIADNRRMLKLKINNYGYVSPYTIRLSDENGKEEKVIIQVGGNLVYIKK